MHIRSRQGALKTILLASSMMTVAPIAAAQDEPARGVDNIVVTSQKRAQSLQDVPISILAFDNNKLEELEVSAFDDYAKFLPSLTFQSTGPNSTTVYFRGVVSGGDGNHSASLPSVGIYLDEQPVTTILGFLPMHIYDIERIEGIAGPQGTLYGASAQSGVLRIITNKPDPSGFEVGVDLEGNTVAHGEQGYQFEGFVNAPLADNAAIRLVGYYKKDAGYIDNVLGTRTFPGSGISKTNAALVEEDFNDVETYGARLALRVDLNENWTVTPSVLAQKSQSEGVHVFDPSLGDLQINRYEPDFNDDKFIQAALTVEGKIGDFDLVYAGAYLSRQIDSNYDYTDYSYYYDVLYQNDGDPTTNFSDYFYDNLGNVIDPTQFYQGDDSFAKYSNEIRLSSPQDRPFRFVLGFFQNHQRHNIHQQYIVRNLADALEVPDHADTIWLTEQQRVDRDLALFTEVEWDITDRLTFIGGVRGYKYKNSLIGFNGYGMGFSGTTGEAACFAPASVPDSPCTNLDSVQKNTGETHKLGLTYDLTDDKMVYLTYSTGFRPGGANRRTPLPPYLEDTLVNYEAGFKTSWADNTFILNSAFFYQQWKDFQFPILGLNGLTEVQNAAQARIMGVEADMTWAPTDRFTLNGAFSVIDAELSENFCGFFDVNRQPVTDCPQAVDDPATLGDETADPEAPKGTPLPVVPKFKGTLTARYEFPLGSFLAHLQGSVSGQTTSPSNLLVLDQAIIGDQEGFVITDFSAGVERDNWKLVAFVNNAFDERPDLYSLVGCPIGTCGPGVLQGTAQPRTVGVRLSMRFGQD